MTRDDINDGDILLWHFCGSNKRRLERADRAGLLGPIIGTVCHDRRSVEILFSSRGFRVGATVTITGWLPDNNLSQFYDCEVITSWHRLKKHMNAILMARELGTGEEAVESVIQDAVDLCGRYGPDRWHEFKLKEIDYADT